MVRLHWVIWPNLGVAISSLYDTRNLGRVSSSPPFVLGPLFLYGVYLESALFPVEVSLTLQGREVLTTSSDLDILEYNLPFFVAVASSVLMCVTALHRISENVSDGFLIKESLNGLATIPCSKAVTITFSPWVWSLTVNAQNLFKWFT